ncbi:MAG TPA: ABC transporter substrate-binding protein, partial [Candidatus Nitrosocosmicus sp.]|nr:ABC transporter substrate-binding protein [Candidatus Nitrosocosmicus sp.]
MVRFVLSSSPRRLPYKIGRLRDHLASKYRPRVKDLKGKTLAINTFGSSADFAIYQLLSRNALDPSKDVTLLSIAGSPDDRFAALIGDSVDATVVNSPFDYRAEQKGFEVLLSTKETVSRQNPHQRAEHVAAKNRTESPMKSCACCARCADGESV